MERERMSLSFVSSLKDCAKKKDLYQGTRIHADIRNSGLLEKNTVLVNTLVSMYAKCGALVRAQQVIDELPVQDVVSWNTLIAGYAKQGQGQKALDCFERMQSKGLSPTAITYACILKACGATQDVAMGKRIHDEIACQGLLKNDVVLGNALVDMYAKCGVLVKAQKALDDLPVRNVVSWSALIAGYVQQGQGLEALGCFQRMRSEGIFANAITYACILKACGITQDSDMGKTIHNHIVSQGLLKQDVVDMYVQQGQGQEALSCFQQMESEGISPNAFTYACTLNACGITQDAVMGENIHNDIVSQGLLKNDVVLGNALIDMYAKCGVLQKAQKVLDELPGRNVVSWNTLITGYVLQGQGQEALGCFQEMQSEDVSPDEITYACILKACGTIQDAVMGKQVHDEIACQGLLKNNVVLGNALIDMYAKCGVLVKAQKVLDELLVRDVVSWSALIAGYVQQGQGQEALGCFQRMQREGISPNAFTYACSLKACGMTQDADMGQKIHDDIVSQGLLLKKDVQLGNALVDMYAKCGVLVKAQKVLDELLLRNVISWSALIAGYVQQGQGQEALGCFQRMRSEQITPNAITYACILKACGIAQDADMGKEIHDDIVSQGLLKKDVVLATALLDMYVQQGQGQEALGCFQRMRNEGISPDAITYVCILKACGIVQEADLGKKIHDDIACQGLLKKDVVLGSALVDMYAKCCLLKKAQKVLDELPIRNVVSWNTLIAGYVQQGQGQEALNCLKRMRSEGISPDAITYACISKACGLTQDADMGNKILDEIASQGLLKNNLVLANALIDMFAKCGVLQKSQKMLDELPVRDVVSWNALIAGYAEIGQGQEALGCFQRMRSDGVSPDEITVYILKAMLTS